MESFYGGKQGISFVIVKQFDGLDIPQPNADGEYTYIGNYYAIDSPGVFKIQVDPLTREPLGPIVRTTENQDLFTWEYHLNDGSNVDEAGIIQFPNQLAQGMKQCFERGGESTSEVGYGEYVIIDTIVNLHDYSHIDNGKVYRRNMNSQGEYGGAEYIGQIVGPQGDSPVVQMDNVQNIKNDPSFMDSHYSAGMQNYSIANGGLVPGDVNDDITYAWVEVKDIFGNTEGVKLGFTFPYTIIDLSATRVDAYTNPTVTRIGDVNKPYYYQWEVTIPEGVHGTEAKDFRIAPSGDGNGDALWYTETDYTNATPLNTDIEVAPYKVINDVNLNNDGTLRVDYSYGNSLVLEKAIKWIKKENDNATGVVLSDDGTFTINYNTGEVDTYPNILTWVTDAGLQDTGEFKLLFNNSNVPNIQKTLEWIRRVEVLDDGTLIFYYNTLDADGNEKIALRKDKFLKILSNVEINTGTVEGEGNQKVKVTYNDGTSAEIGNPLNYIIESVVTDEETAIQYNAPAYHLLVLYADPMKRGNITYPSIIFGEDRNDWIDLGFVRGEKGEIGGLKVIGDIDSVEDLKKEDGSWKTPEEVLGENWNEDYHGWGITVNSREMFVYDYIKKLWYSIGELSITPKSIIAISETSDGIDLLNNGIWLIKEYMDVV